MKELSLKIALLVDNYLPPDGVIHGWRESQRIKLNQEIFSLIEQSNNDRWISVEERLPENNDLVIGIFSPTSSFCIVRKHQTKNHFVSIHNDGDGEGDYECSESITHWQPLPTAPKTK